jgi:hypothetical protein
MTLTWVLIPLGLGYAGCRFGEAAVKWALAQALKRGWVK